MRNVLKSLAVLSLGVLFGCASTDDIPEKKGSPDPDAPYHNPNAPFSPPFTPVEEQKKEKDASKDSAMMEQTHG